MLIMMMTTTTTAASVTTDRAAAGSTDALPGPDQRPTADVVVFDGQCRICRRQIGWLARCDPGGRLAYLSLHDAETARRYPDLSHDELMRQMVVVDARGRRHGGAAAVRYLSRRLPRLWWLAPLMHFPLSLPLWQWLYRQVASRRYLLGRIESCEEGTCHLHP